MSQILNNVSQENDLSKPSLDIKLKNRYEFQDLIEHKPKSSENGAMPMDFDSLVNFIKTHNKCHKLKNSENQLNCCLIICQTLLGIRFDNLKDLFRDNRNFIQITKKSCKSCSSKIKTKPCKTIEAKCLDTIIFKRTKVQNQVKTFIIPQIQNCLNYISKQHSNQLNYHSYNNFIKTNSNNQYTSHSCRKFLTNLSLKNRNTGGWSAYKTLEKNYTASHTKFAEISTLLNTKIIH